MLGNMSSVNIIQEKSLEEESAGGGLGEGGYPGTSSCADTHTLQRHGTCVETFISPC